MNALEVLPSNYQGPTGIIGILHAQFQEHGLSSTSLWAAVPHYVTQSPQPGAICELLNTLAIEEDDEAAGYVADLEERYDDGDISQGFDMISEELPDVGDIASEVEQFLRDQPGEK